MFRKATVCLYLHAHDTGSSGVVMLALRAYRSGAFGRVCGIFSGEFKEED
ncbi:hypothetical protein [Coxiella-like endosymbiont]|nr:hypothetical protein [Coxiella-like endosymbiont]